MDIKNIVEQLSQLSQVSINDNLIKSSSNNIDISQFKKRADVIKKIQSILNLITNAQQTLTVQLNELTTADTHERKLAEMMLDGSEILWKKQKNKQQPTFAQKVIQTLPNNVNSITLSSSNVYNTSINSTQGSSQSTHGSSQPNLTRPVKFTDSLFLDAIFVKSFAAVTAPGALYYVERSRHFAIIIAGVMFHGNIGTIYCDEKNPEKVTNCKYGSHCVKSGCNYYHDPFKFSNSQDYRNYIASSFLYIDSNLHRPNGQTTRSQLYDANTLVEEMEPSTSQQPRIEKYKNRRFGSRHNLEQDILLLNEDEILRFHDQTMHDILCSLLLTIAYKKT